MRANQSLWTARDGWTGRSGGSTDLLLAFGSSRAMADSGMWQELSRRYPAAITLGCSTGGEIHGSDVLDDSVSVTTMAFDRTRLKPAQAAVKDAKDSFEAGKSIGGSLAASDLKTIFLLSDGTRV